MVSVHGSECTAAECPGERAISDKSADDFDVIVVGAGIAGIGAAYRLAKEGRRFLVLEKRASIGGTWDLNRFPGVRSDLEMFSYAFQWHPWKNAKQLFGTGEGILDYLHDIVQQHGLGGCIHTGVGVVSADFSSTDICWTVRTSTGKCLRSRYVFIAMGYYEYDEPNTPKLPGMQHFSGQVLHPQHWPQDINVSNKNVVIIGSGATAVTIGPELSKAASSVTIVQRTPSWVQARSTQEYWVPRLLRILAPEAANRLSAILYPLNDTNYFFWAKLFPSWASRWYRKHAQQYLGHSEMQGYVTPSFAPWDQRVCSTPNGEWWTLIRQKKLRIVTDRIRELTQTGVVCDNSGEELKADLIVAATGFNFQRSFPLNDVSCSVDGVPYNSGQTMLYKSLMLSDVPNLFFTAGYFHAAYTQRVDLSWIWACRVMKHAEQQGCARCVVSRDFGIPELDRSLYPSTGYVQRALETGMFPKAPAVGTSWSSIPDPFVEGRALRTGNLIDGVLRLSKL